MISLLLLAFLALLRLLCGQAIANTLEITTSLLLQLQDRELLLLLLLVALLLHHHLVALLLLTRPQPCHVLPLAILLLVALLQTLAAVFTELVAFVDHILNLLLCALLPLFRLDRKL